MPVRFDPSGFLDVATDPSDLPFESAGKTAVSSAMTRCTNLSLDRLGVAKTRAGSTKINGSALSTPIHRIVEQGGVRYVFGGGNIYRNESSTIATGLTSAKWSAIKYNAYNVTDQSIFALNGTDRKRITGSTVAEWGIAAPTVAPTVAGNLTGYAYAHSWEADYISGSSYQFWRTSGNYQYLFDWEDEQLSGIDGGSDSATSGRRMWSFELESGRSASLRFGVKYTYCRKNGSSLECESNPSPVAYIEAGTGIYVTWTAPSDSQVTHVRVYRTLADMGSFYYANEFAYNASGGVLTTQDESLGSEAATDHDRPPLGTIVLGPDFNGYCFIVKDNLLYYCKAHQPEYWPALYYVEVAPPQTPVYAAIMANGQVYCLTKSDIYAIQGTGYQSFFPVRESAATGAHSEDGVAVVRGKGLHHVSTDGLWAFSGTADDNVTNPRFRPVFTGETCGTIPGYVSAQASRAWLLPFKNKLYFGFPAGSDVWPSDVLVMDIGSGKIVHYDYGRLFQAVCVDVYNDRILAGDSAGYIWEIEDASATADDVTAIAWDWQSGEVTDQVRQYFPRSAKYDVDVGGTAAAQIILNGASVQSHTLSGSRNTTKRLVATSTGKRLQSRIYGTGTVSIYAAEVE